MISRKVLLIGILTAFFSGAVFLGKEKIHKTICEDVNGDVWASNGAECITSLCFYEGDCRLRAFPAAHCAEVRIGDHISEVYLRLGMPMDVNGNSHMWVWDKTASEIGVAAQFKNHTLVALDCPAYPYADEVFY